MSINLVNLIISAAVSLFGTGIGVALLQGVFSRDGRRADAARTQTEAQARRHEVWFKEAQVAYDRVSKECSDCRAELRKADEVHRKEIDGVRRDLSEVRDALIKRVDAFDEILPYVQGLPDDKLRELRAANRAVKMAIWAKHP
jgi:hypothetical protein